MRPNADGYGVVHRPACVATGAFRQVNVDERFTLCTYTTDRILARRPYIGEPQDTALKRLVREQVGETELFESHVPTKHLQITSHTCLVAVNRKLSMTKIQRFECLLEDTN